MKNAKRESGDNLVISGVKKIWNKRSGVRRNK
jgi:hypothetical protein